MNRVLTHPQKEIKGRAWSEKMNEKWDLFYIKDHMA